MSFTIRNIVLFLLVVILAALAYFNPNFLAVLITPSTPIIPLDSDNDGLSDTQELSLGTDPANPDTDGDGLSDGAEINAYHTDPLNPDTDSDGFPDGFEVRAATQGYDPLVFTTPVRRDSDGDGLQDVDELRIGTDPLLADTDGDGLNDGVEVNTHYTIPTNADSDGDGLSDGDEVNLYSTNPNAWDTDGDLLPDGIEVTVTGWDPLVPDNPQGDLDGDGLSNLDEIIYGSRPDAADTDGDGVNDGDEVVQGSNPNDASDQGLAPSPADIVDVRLTVGDQSGSHSERYNLKVGSITHQAPQFGVVSSRIYNHFRRGQSYPVSIVHTGSNVSPPDFDYVAYIEPVDPNECIYIEDPDGILGTHSATPPDPFYAAGKSAELHIELFDLDIDSNNDDALNFPDRSIAEDDAENIIADPDRPGKLIAVNDADWDNDGIPDFADGFNLLAGSSEDDVIATQPQAGDIAFVPMILELSSSLNLNEAKLRFNYSASDPQQVRVSGAGTLNDPHIYTPAPGQLRIWTAKASAQRSSDEVNAGGHFVNPQIEYTAADLGGGSSTIVLFVEGIQSSSAPGNELISVELDPNGSGQAPGYACIEEVRSTVYHYSLLDQGGQKVDTVKEISHPRPKVEVGIGQNLSEITLNDMTIDYSAKTAKVHVNGIIYSHIADIAGGSADIIEINMRHMDVNGQYKTVSIPVVNTSNNTIEDYRPLNFDSDISPRPYIGKFNHTLVIPIQWGANRVSFEATNAIGGQGYDSFTLHVKPDENNPSTPAITVENNESSKTGTFNPVWIKIEDQSLSSLNLSNTSVDFFGQSFPLIERAGEIWIDRPFIQTSHDLQSGIIAENIINAEAQASITTVKYREHSRKVDWSYTAASPSNYYKYAAGTTVTHQWYSNELGGSGWRVNSVAVQELTGFTWRFSGTNDTNARVIAWRNIPPHNGKPGVEFTLNLPNSALANPQKSLNLHLVKGNQSKRVKWAAEFKVVPLKTVIVGVDGLAHDAAVSVINQANSGFNEVFSGYVHHVNEALGPLPTITWGNWPGIFSGQPPKEHGWQGNSWFARETTSSNKLLPFNSANSFGSGILNIDNRQSIGVALGEFALPHAWSMNQRKLSGAGSLYDNIGAVASRADNKLHTLSANFFYSYTAGNIVNMEDHFWPAHTRYTEHSPAGAKRVDENATENAVDGWQSNGDRLDVLSLYLPGPDNVAHHIGAMTGDPTGNPPINYGSAVGSIGQTTSPLPSISLQAMLTSDVELKKLIKEIKDDGYFNAVLFALVADHGLVAYRNTDDFNIMTEDRVPTNTMELQELINAASVGGGTVSGGMGKNLWRGSSSSRLINYNFVYSPNGGMGHIYLRSNGRTWQQPPLTSDIKTVAERLFFASTSPPVAGSVPAYAELAPRPASGTGAGTIPATVGAFGDPPAIFVRFGGTDATDAVNSNFLKDFKWLTISSTQPYQPVYVDISNFINARRQAGRPVNWPAFAERINLDLNHKERGGSRTGDIIVVMDSDHGYLTINHPDRFNGWHGGPSRAESSVPLFVNMPGAAIVNPAGQSNPNFVVNGFNTGAQSNPMPDGHIRSYKLSDILEQIIGSVRNTTDPQQ